ncbi:hypothetical protein WA158_006419 [Blastocystis sp. Blastoise]
MVKEKVPFDFNQFNFLKEDINLLEELMKDVTSVLSSVMNLGVHSESRINNFVSHIHSWCDLSGSLKSNDISIDDSDSQEESQVKYKNKRKYQEEHIEDMDMIRFTNNGPAFALSKTIIDSMPYSYIYEQSKDELRTDDGTIFLNFNGNDIYVYCFLNYLYGKKVDFDQFNDKEQLELLDLFEFCNLPLPVELVNCRVRRDTLRKYEEGDEVDLIINGKKNDIIKNYLVNNGLWNDYAKNYDHGFVDYNVVDNSLYINKKYEYIDNIIEYVNNGTIDIEESKVINISKELLEKEMVELFGNKGREEAKRCTIRFNYFKGTKIFDSLFMEELLMSWLGREKK